MNVKLYHRDIGFPKNAFDGLLGCEYPLNYTRHAMLEAVHDKNGTVYNVPKHIRLDPSQVVEIEQTNGITTKLVIRLFYAHNRGYDMTSGRDLVLVMRPSDAGFTVTTLWTNLVDDVHATLDKTKYATP